jgi:hypothetical protein
LSAFRTNADIKNALSKTLRLPLARIYPLTDEDIINAQIANYALKTSIMVAPTYYFEFAISPDTNDATQNPMLFYENLLEDNY